MWGSCGDEQVCKEDKQVCKQSKEEVVMGVMTSVGSRLLILVPRLIIRCLPLGLHHIDS